MSQPGGGKLFRPTPPLNGSFPLDHEGLCKEHMLRYMICVQSRDGYSSACRDLARDYFACRMEHKLMDAQEWPKLGFSRPTSPPEPSSPLHPASQ